MVRIIIQNPVQGNKAGSCFPKVRQLAIVNEECYLLGPVCVTKLLDFASAQFCVFFFFFSISAQLLGHSQGSQRLHPSREGNCLIPYMRG